MIETILALTFALSLVNTLAFAWLIFSQKPGSSPVLPSVRSLLRAPPRKTPKNHSDEVLWKKERDANGFKSE